MIYIYMDTRSYFAYRGLGYRQYIGILCKVRHGSRHEDPLEMHAGGTEASSSMMADLSSRSTSSNATSPMPVKKSAAKILLQND